MQLSSSVFNHMQHIPSKYTCDGENINPPLEIKDVPSSAKSLVLVMDDPDVPPHIRADKMWDHWIVFNISPSILSIDEGNEPEGIHGKGTSDNLNYNGPCPPDREHRYFFKLYALDVSLQLEEGSTKKEIEKAMDGHVIEKCELIGLYERVK
jgi:Raf kinase inhibitor-like YbhB/YbcL family protein